MKGDDNIALYEGAKISLDLSNHVPFETYLAQLSDLWAVGPLMCMGASSISRANEDYYFKFVVKCLAAYAGLQGALKILYSCHSPTSFCVTKPCGGLSQIYLGSVIVFEVENIVGSMLFSSNKLHKAEMFFGGRQVHPWGVPDSIFSDSRLALQSGCGPIHIWVAVWPEDVEGVALLWLSGQHLVIGVL